MTSSSSSHANTVGNAPRRADIDGLRALAILLVVAYHVWLGRVSGGVDVFLMISAFLLTGSFTRMLTESGTVRVGAYWLRTFSRLLPAAVVTILGVLATTFIAFPSSSWPTIWRQAWASLFYVENWELAFSNVDYYARDEIVPSPLQHFWSLSVQGQVFVLWPLIFVVVAFVVRRTALRPVGTLAIVFGIIFAVSLGFSIVETSQNQAFAYFDSRTRLWEFAAGSLVALAAPRFAASAPVRAVMGWIGVVGIIACGIVLDVHSGFPGYLALWPVLCAAAIILAGTARVGWGPTAFLSSRPLRALGRDAYALYLVHWPVLVTWLVVTERTRVGWLAGTAIVLLSLVLARLLARVVENPVRVFSRRGRPVRRSALTMVACLTAVAVPLMSWQVVERTRVASLAAEFDGQYPGATALLPDAEAVPRDVPVWPLGSALGEEWVALDEGCRGDYMAPTELLQSTCSETRAPGWTRDLVVVVGDSHAQQWMGAVLPIAHEQGWDVVALLKGGCAFGFDEPPVAGVVQCDEWREAVVEFVGELNPSVVFGMATKTVTDSPEEHVPAGLQRAADEFAATGAAVVLLRDNPRFSTDPFVCVETLGPDAAQCRTDRSDALAAENPARVLSGVQVVDLSDFLCPGGVCVPVIGNIAVYMDANHLTRSFASTLAPMLAEELVRGGILG